MQFLSGGQAYRYKKGSRLQREKVLSYQLRRLSLIALFLFQLAEIRAAGQSKPYRKATAQDDEVVKHKLFPKQGKFELSGPDIGFVLNQSYITSFILHGNANYYWREDWGLSLEGLIALNQDKSERLCIESFYNDIEDRISAACPAPGQDPAAELYTGEQDASGQPIVIKGASFGPAYVPIRELDYILTAAAIWTPVYGKQLAFLSQTIYFDLFLSMGAGVSGSTFYPEQTILKNGNLSRGNAPAEIPPNCSAPPLPGVCPDAEGGHLASIGDAGRPAPISESLATLTAGIGQKIHFYKRYNFKAELRNYTLLGTPTGFDSFFMAWLGLGVRF